MRFRIIDLVVCSTSLALFGVLALAGDAKLEEEQNRIKCAGNLRQIGLALKLYANENRGRFPRTIHDEQDPTPVWGTPYEANEALGPAEGANPFAPDGKPVSKYRPKPNDVTAAFYLLMRTQDIVSSVYVCPATRASMFDFGGAPWHALHWTNWRGNRGIAAHLTYSYCNPYTSAPVRQKLRDAEVNAREFAVAADMNSGAAEVLELTLQSRREKMRAGNSLNHNLDGQNVLYADAHVEFRANPFAGQKRDNIYTFNGAEVAARAGETGIIGPIADADDSVLLPTAGAVLQMPPSHQGR